MEETIILTFIGKDGVEYTLDYSNNYSVVANIALSAGIERDILWSLFIEIKNATINYDCIYKRPLGHYHKFVLFRGVEPRLNLVRALNL